MTEFLKPTIYKAIYNDRIKKDRQILDDIFFFSERKSISDHLQ